MASRFWRGVNTNFTDTANWSATRTGATGQTAPSASDDVSILDGDLDITSNITAATMLSCVIGGNFKGNIPGMTVNTAGCVVTIRNVGFGKTITIGADAAVTLANVHVRSTGQGTVTIANGAAGVVTNVYAGKIGRLVVQGDVTNLYCAGMPVQAEYSATAFTIADFESGSHNLYRSATTFTIGAGAQVRTYNSVASATLCTVNGGSLLHDSDGTIALLHLKPGGQLVPVTTAFAVTNSVIWEGSVPNKGSAMVTYTNASTNVGDPD